MPLTLEQLYDKRNQLRAKIERLMKLSDKLDHVITLRETSAASLQSELEDDWQNQDDI